MPNENAAQSSQVARRPVAGLAPARLEADAPPARPGLPRHARVAPRASLLSVGQVARVGILVALALGFAQLPQAGRAHADGILAPAATLTLN